MRGLRTKLSQQLSLFPLNFSYRPFSSFTMSQGTRSGLNTSRQATISVPEPSIPGSHPSHPPLRHAAHFQSSMIFNSASKSEARTRIWVRSRGALQCPAARIKRFSSEPGAYTLCTVNNEAGANDAAAYPHQPAGKSSEELSARDPAFPSWFWGLPITELTSS